MGLMARADTVKYSTSWDFAIGPSSQTYSKGILHLNNMNLAFRGKGLGALLPATGNTPSELSLGSFVVTGSLGSDIFASVPFDLEITQYAPTSGTAEFMSELTGTISRDASSLVVAFDEPSVQIGNIIYTLEDQVISINPDRLLGLDPGVTAIDAFVTTRRLNQQPCCCLGLA
jgi:hypothetical protein